MGISWYFLLQGAQMCVRTSETQPAAAILLFCNKGAHRSVSYEYFLRCVFQALHFDVEHADICHAYHLKQWCQNPNQKWGCRHGDESDPRVRDVGWAAICEFFEIALAVDAYVARRSRR